MDKLTRRSALAAIPVVGLAPIVPAMASQADITEIEALFAEWLAVANGPQDPAEDDNWGESRYVRLQAHIVAAEPTTPRDVAIQFFVDCDQFGSDVSEHFEALVTRLIGPTDPTT